MIKEFLMCVSHGFLSHIGFTSFDKGTGASPDIGTPCECHYAGTLTDGTEFDSSYKRVS